MGNDQIKQHFTELAEILHLPQEEVDRFDSLTPYRQLTIVLTLGQQAARQNAQLTSLVERLRAEIEKTMPPMLSIATVIGIGGTGEFVDIHKSGQEMRVPVSNNVDTSTLTLGSRVLLDDTLVAVKVIDLDGHGEIVTIKEILQDKERALVVTHNDDERVVHLSSALIGSPLQQGHSLLVNTRTGIATELIPKTEVNDLTLEEVPDISYENIGGLADQVKKIRDAVELPFLQPELFEQYQLKAPKGVLLYGPPGCGKTMIAKAIANSLAKKAAEKADHDVKAFFLNVKGPELLNKYVGETERHIRLIFQRAREKASAGHPVIVFFDEMEAMFHTRGSGISSDVEKTIVPQLLTELDGVENLDNVIVIGASNRQDMIDPAVLRPGRLDIKIKIERPDAVAATDIFMKYLNADLPLHKSVLDDFNGNRTECISYLIEQTVQYMYETSSRTEFLEAVYANGDKEMLYFKDFSSGAMIQNIVDRAKKSAILDQVECGQEGIQIQHLLDACNAEFQDNEDLPNTTNPTDWENISSRKAGRIVGFNRQLHKDVPTNKPIENVPLPTGQYF